MQFRILDLCISIRLNILVKGCFVAYLWIYDSDQDIEEWKSEVWNEWQFL